MHQIGDERIEKPSQRLICGQTGRGVGVAFERGIVEAAEERHGLTNFIERENAGVEAVVEIGGEVGNFVGQVDELRFKRRDLVEKISASSGWTAAE